LTTIVRSPGGGSSSGGGYSPVTLTASSGTITPNAALGYGPHRYTATGPITLASPTGGTNGEPIEVQVTASGADRALTVAGSTVTIPSGSTWWGHFSYDSGLDRWHLDDAGGGTAGTSYTDEQVRDVMAATLVQGTNIILTPNDAADTITIAATGGASYSDEQAQDAAAALFSGGSHSGITFTYNDASNTLNAAVTSGEGATYTGNKTINGRFGVNKATSVKQPINMGATLNASTVSGSTDDKICIELSGNLTGDFTSDSGSNPGFAWGMNGFFTTGSSANDGKGLTDVIGGLVEMCVQTPAGTTFPVLRGFQAEAAFFGASAGATVTQMESMRVSAPKRKDGATAGTATNVYGLFIEDTTAYNVGATNRWSLFVEGGISRFQGRVDIADTVVSYNATLNLQGDYSGNGRIRLTTNGIGFFGATPITRPTLPSSGSVTAADIRTALINLGLCQ
jgi:hypothetical protein